MHRARIVLLPLLLLVLAPLVATQASAQGATLEVLRAPDVVVASDFEGEERTTPRYLFSVEARLTNGNTERTPALHAVTYLDPKIAGCPERQDGVRPVHLFAKNPQLGPREVFTFGGDKAQQQGQPERYWPLEVYRKYPTPAGTVAENPEGEHGFCVVAIVSGNDPACDKPPTQVCTLAAAPFRAYVRHGNHPPVIGEVTMAPETPRPGEQVLLRAAATDADRTPKRDTLRYIWTIGGDTLHGPVQRLSFNTPGERAVTLVVSDGFEDVTHRLNLTIEGQPVTRPGNGNDGANGTPFPLLAALLGAIVAARIRRRP